MGTKRPNRTGELNSAGKAITVSDGAVASRADAPPPADPERDCTECSTPTKRASGLCKRCDPASKRNRGTDKPARSPSAELLANAVEALVDSDDWKRWLNVQRQFHNYSFGNTMLIAWQNPDATRVAGRKKWEELGRPVNPDARSIQILAPCTVNEKDVETGEVTGEKRTFFRIVEVYDIADTDGEPLPEVTRRLEGEAPEGMLTDLHRHAANIGVPVTFTSPNDDRYLSSSCNGYAAKDADGSMRIVVSADMSPAQQAKTFAHELGHVALGHLDDTDTTVGHLDRADKEIAAESFACMLSGAYGLNTDDYSFGYVAAWSGGNPKKVRAIADQIVKAVRPYLPADTD